MATQMASFLAPGADPMAAQQLSQEQQLLLARLAQQQQGLAPQLADGGKYKALDFTGLANVLASARTEDKLDSNRRKQADLLGAHQKAILEEMQKYDPKDPTSRRRARTLGIPELAKMAGDDEKAAAESEKEERDRKAALERALLERLGFNSAIGLAQGKGLDGAQPRQTQTVQGGMVIGTAEGQPPEVLAGKWEPPAPVPGVGMAQVQPFTGKVDETSKAPRTTIINPGDKAGRVFLENEATEASKRAATLRQTLGPQLSALERAEETAARGAFQGKLAGLKQAASGIGYELGLNSDQINSLLSNTEMLDSDMGKFVLANVKLLGANPSNADREYSERTAGGKQLTSDGLAAVIRAAKADILTSVNAHNQHVARLAQDVPPVTGATIKLPRVVNGPRRDANEISLPGYTMSEDGRYVRDLQQAAPAGAPTASSNVDDIARKYLPKPGGN